MKHVKSFTYEPKIQRVKSGEITQTIRPVNKWVNRVQVGDHILFHGWEDRPYRSKWSWRLPVKVTGVQRVDLYTAGMWICNEDDPSLGVWWHWVGLDQIAWLDGIEDGVEMGRLFNSMYSLPVLGDEAGKVFQIITWETVPVQTQIGEDK